MNFHPHNREKLKDSVREAITKAGSTNKTKRKFKKLVEKAMRNTSPLTGYAIIKQIDAAHELIGTLWAEVTAETHSND